MFLTKDKKLAEALVDGASLQEVRDLAFDVRKANPYRNCNFEYYIRDEITTEEKLKEFVDELTTGEKTLGGCLHVIKCEQSDSGKTNLMHFGEWNDCGISFTNKIFDGYEVVNIDGKWVPNRPFITTKGNHILFTDQDMEYNHYDRHYENGKFTVYLWNEDYYGNDNCQRTFNNEQEAEAYITVLEKFDTCHKQDISDDVLNELGDVIMNVIEEMNIDDKFFYEFIDENIEEKVVDLVRAQVKYIKRGSYEQSVQDDNEDQKAENK